MIEKLLIKSAAWYKRPLIIIIVAAIFTIGFGSFSVQMKYDNNLSAMIPQNHPDLATNNYYERPDVFGSSGIDLIGIEAPSIYDASTLTYIRSLIDEIKTTQDSVNLVTLKNAFLLNDENTQKMLTALRASSANEADFAKDIYPKLKDSDWVQKSFGLDQASAASVAMKSPLLSAQKIWRYSQVLVTNVQSLANADYIVGENEELKIEPILPEGEITPEVVAKLKSRIESWPLYKDLLASSDGTMTTLLLELANNDPDLMDNLYVKLSTILAKHPENIKTYLTGETVIASFISSTMKSDMVFLMPFVILVVIAILWLCFRNLTGVIFPLIVIIISVVTGVGIQAMFGVPMTVVGSAMPVLLVAIASAYGIHQMNHYFSGHGTERHAILVQNMKSVGLAITLSGITVMIGFGALAIEDFVPVANFGIFTAVGDLIAVGAALYILPAFLLLSKKPKTQVLKNESRGFVYSLLKGFVTLTRKHPGKILLISIVLTLGFGVGSIFVKSEMNYISFFKKDNVIHVADDKLNEKLAGTQSMSVIFDSDLSDIIQRIKTGKTGEIQDLTSPVVLNKIDEYASAVQKKFPIVTKVVGFNDIIKKLNKEMNNGDPAKYAIPESSDLIAQYLLLFGGNTSSYLTSDKDKLRVILSFKRTSTSEIEEIRNFTLSYFDKAFKEANHLQVNVIGYAHLASVSNELMVEGMFRSIIACVAVVFILLLFVLRSLRLSIVAMAPIIITLAINYGVLGFFGISLNSGTAMVSSIAIGIGVDFSIHYITWYRNELRRHKEVRPSLDATIIHKGRAIIYNMFVIAGGFGVLAFSSFNPLVEFGLLVALCMVTTALGALVVVPAIIDLMSRKLKKTDFLLLGTHKEAPEVQKA